MGKHKDVIIAVIVTYLLVSFVPSIGAGAFFGKLGGGSGGKKIL